MTITSRLFNVESLRKEARLYFKGTEINEKFRSKKTEIEKWAKLADDNRNNAGTEQRFKSDFLNFLFMNLFEYDTETNSRKERGERYFDIRKETKSETDRKKPDAVLGFFQANTKVDKRVKAVVEVKGFDACNLDARLGKDHSPVTQAFEYQTKFCGCEWIIVSNMDQVRLYHILMGNSGYFSFRIEDLLIQDNFLIILYIFHKSNLMSKGPYQSLSYKNIEIDWDAEKKAIDSLFPLYEKAKKEILRFFLKKGINEPLKYTQKLLNRFLFINIASAREIIPKNIGHILQEAIECEKPNEKKVREIFKNLDIGNKAEGIVRYNGGLFKECDVIDSIQLPKSIYSSLAGLAQINYQSGELNSEILGKVFQKSLEMTKLDYVKDTDSEKKDTDSEAKKTGAVYTSYLVAQIMSQIAFDSIKEKRKENLSNLKILDPCCGSGTFVFSMLNQFRNYLVGKNIKVNRKTIQKLLDKNIFAIDINEAAAEITKLSLYLDLADKILPLPDCKEGNIKSTDALTINNKAAYDIIIGNPPYVKYSKLKSDYKEYLTQAFNVNKKPTEFKGTFQYDLYMSFFEKASKLLKDNGVLVFICSSKFMFKDYGINLRRMLATELPVERIYDVSQMDLFGGVSVYPYIFVCRKKCRKASDKVEIFSNLLKIQDLVNQDDGKIKKTERKLDDILKDDEHWIYLSRNESIISEISKNLIFKRELFSRGVPLEKLKVEYQSQFLFISPNELKGTFIDKEKNVFWGYNNRKYMEKKKGEFLKQLIVLPRTVPRKIIASLTDSENHIADRVYYFDPADVGDHDCQSLILPFLNSTIATYLYSHRYNSDQISGGYWDLNNSTLNSIGFIDAKSVSHESKQRLKNSFSKLEVLDKACYEKRCSFVNKYQLSERDLGVYSFQNVPSFIYFSEIKKIEVDKNDYSDLLKIHLDFKKNLLDLDCIVGEMLGLSREKVIDINLDVMSNIVSPVYRGNKINKIINNTRDELAG